MYAYRYMCAVSIQVQFPPGSTTDDISVDAPQNGTWSSVIIQVTPAPNRTPAISNFGAKICVKEKLGNDRKPSYRNIDSSVQQITLV